ncbi:MAG: PKD domain-containing protein [candidate division Zixibacteria bacterium]|nr:PKD domain-containing protein [candidate division Zixibacteria bacterium]MDH3936196.1 PKD domain-containing protein [candidate division Zixibacteria bacterium]MDH4033065.1 PKD domain-containing protein [candidate division Zixibacteria bacterium]
MKTCAVALLMVCLIAPLATSADQIKQIDRPDRLPSFLGYKSNEFIVVMRPDVGKLSTQKAASGIVAIGETDFDNISKQFVVSRIKKQFPGTEAGALSPTAELAKYHKVKFEQGTLDEAMEAYRNHPMVEKVEPIGIHTMLATPNDGFFDPYQWYHNQTNDDDLDSPEAWDIQTGSSSFILAILDSGTRYYHRDLGGGNTSPSNEAAARGNMWINNAELNGSTGVDDDGNGYTDDWIGYDFISSTSNCWPGEDCNTQDNDPRDFNGHGTHTAGIVGMITNNGYGMAGVAGGWGNGSEQQYGNGVKVMACRMGFSYNHPLYGEVGVVYMDAAAEAFYYAADNGAKIASCSWGSSNSGGIGAAANYFLSNGGLIFVAAGNDGTQSADYLNGRGDCISVAATNQNDGAASFTTYGTWVDICAPGVGIYSTYHDHYDPSVDYWASMDGTSMACPMAAAVGAMIWSQNPTWTASQVETQLYASAENIDAELSGAYIGKMGAGRINLYDAVNTGPPPPPVAAFVGSPTSGTEPLTVNFTDQSTGSITDWSWTFGDGGSSTSQNPSYEYTSAGTYDVTLTVTGPGGSDGETKNGYITVNPCVAPTADFSGSPTSGTEPLDVSFTDLSTGATSWSWTFGDGGNSTQQNPNYTYDTAGTYTVTLTATNACGSDVNTKVDYITVNPCVSPTADFSGTPTNGEVPLDVSFTDLSTGATSWSWTFGDGGNSTQQNPNYTYNTAGTYTVTLTATNACGSDVNTKVDYITADPSTAVNQAFALSDIPVNGTASGSYLNTQASDDSYEGLTEGESGGKPSRRYSTLDWKWNFSVIAGATTSFNVEAYRPDNAEGDDFAFEYSTDDINYSSLVTVTSAVEQMYSVSMPNVSGTVYIRCVDTDHTQGARTFDDVFIDYMYIETGGTPPPPDTMHVNSITVTRIGGKGNRYNGQATVTILNQSGQPVGGASVTGDFSGPSSDTQGGTTDGSGSVTLTSQRIKSPVGNWCFTVTGVSLGSNVYDPSQNVESSDCEGGAAKLVDGSMPYTFNLDQNYPNPFNPKTSIRFSLPSSMNVRLEVFNVLGQNVATLYEGTLNAGLHEYEFDASHLSSGIYLYRLQADDMIETKKMVLMK